MTAKKSDYLIIYCFVFASILCIAVLARLFVVTELQMDEFSGTVAFVVACLLFSAASFSFQSFVNEWLQPVVERIFRKKHPQMEPKPEVDPIQPLEIVASQEETAVPNYEEYKQTAQQKIQQEQAQILENVLTYTGEELSLYLKESELQQLCEHIRFFQYATEKECEQINTPVTVDTRLKSIDLMHFGWNIGNQFNKSGIETATFIKHVFTAPFEKVETSTIKIKSLCANKSHPLSFAMKPFVDFDHRQNIEFGKLYAKYEQDVSLTKKERKSEGLEEFPHEPIRKRFLVSDITPEGLSYIHAQNWRVQCLYSDELSAWFKNFNRYNNGSEEQFWLSVFSAKVVISDRKNAESSAHAQ